MSPTPQPIVASAGSATRTHLAPPSLQLPGDPLEGAHAPRPTAGEPPATPPGGFALKETSLRTRTLRRVPGDEPRALARAVRAAAPGDVLWLEPGIHHACAWREKGLTLAGTPAARLEPGPHRLSLRVAALGSDQSLTLLGLDLGAVRVELEELGGPVWIEGRGPGRTPCGPVLAESCASLTLVGLELARTGPVAALEATDSRLALYDCVLASPDGWGLRLETGHATLAGGSIDGAQGAVWLDTGEPHLEAFGTTLGLSSARPLNLVSGSFERAPLEPSQLRAELEEEGGRSRLALHYRAAVGESVFTLVAASPSLGQVRSALGGPYHVEGGQVLHGPRDLQAARTEWCGPLVAPPDCEPGALPLYLQPVFLDSRRRAVRVGGPSAVLLSVRR